MNHFLHDQKKCKGRKYQSISYFNQLYVWDRTVYGLLTSAQTGDL